jgi:hypothetical protein
MSTSLFVVDFHTKINVQKYKKEPYDNNKKISIKNIK